MCDIVVALPDSTARHRVIFGKNSDRPAGECQVWYDSRDERRAAGGAIRCAFVKVPDVAAPLRTRGCRPYWCWGYETGANEAGVVAGNTAVFTRPFQLSENRGEFGLTGMELMRLGLERGRTAEAVVRAIASLLGEYGQWAPAVAGRDAPQGCYDNAYLVADAREAWILETAGRRWAARRFTSGVHSLSNELTIRDTWTAASDDLDAYAIARGWWTRENGPLDFARAYSDHEHYARQVSHVRCRRSAQLMAEHAGRVTPETVMGVLRDHYESTFLGEPAFDVFLPDFLTLCMHDSPAGFTWGNTATSVVVEIDPGAPGASPCWWSYQPPCTSIYVSSTLDAELPPSVKAAGTAGLRAGSPVGVTPDAFDQGSLWWRLYRLLTAVARDPGPRRRAARERFDAVERAAIERLRALESTPSDTRRSRVDEAVRKQVAEVEGILSDFEKAWRDDATAGRA